jgi:hypothetical protein
MRITKKSSVAALGAVLALTLSACGGNDPADTGAPSAGATSGGASSAPAPSADAKPLAEIPDLNGKTTAVKLDPMFLAGLESLKLTPAMLGGGKLEDGSIIFPITGGELAYFDPKSGVEPFVQGEILHEGSGLSLSGGGKTVMLEDFVVDPEKSVLTGKVTADGQVVGESVELFFLDGSTVKPLAVDMASSTAVLEGTTVSLTKTAADALNGVFGVTALTEFFPVGIAKITVEVPKS